MKPPLATMIGRTLSMASTDVTDLASRRPCLVLSPHPDDETLGCAVSVMRRVDAGTPVHIAVVSDGSQWPPDRDPKENAATRRAEFLAAGSLLGLSPDDLTLMGFPDRGLAEADEALVDAIADVVRRHKPEDVLATAEHDPHGDHAAVGIATRRALGGTGVRLLIYPVWQWVRPGAWLRTVKASQHRPQTVRTEGFLERKAAAVESYQSQLRAPVDARGENTSEPAVSPAFLTNFLGPTEIFFPVTVGQVESHGN